MFFLIWYEISQYNILKHTISTQLKATVTNGIEVDHQPWYEPLFDPHV